MAISLLLIALTSGSNTGFFGTFNHLPSLNIQEASAGVFTSFSRSPLGTLGNSQNVEFFGVTTGTGFGSINVREDTSSGAIICSTAYTVGSWSCDGAPDWTTPSSGSGSKTFWATAIATTAVSLSISWEPPNNPPVVTSTPSNPANQEYSTSGVFNLANWAATDTDASTYIIQRRFASFSSGTTCGSYGGYSTVRSSTTWVSGTNYNFDHPKTLAIGCYDYRAGFTDGKPQTVSSTPTTVKNVDTTSPIVTVSPSDVTYESGDTRVFNIQWTATDLLPNTYIIERNFNGGSYSTVFGPTAWTSGNAIGVYDVGDLVTAGTYNHRVRFDDGTNNVWETQITTVTSDTNPSYTGTPSNQQYESGNTDTVNINWSFSDNQEGDTWEVRYQATSFGASCSGGTLLAGPTSWAGGTIGSSGTYNVGGLTSDRYYCIVIEDQAFNTAFDEMLVDIVVAANPTYSAQPSDVQYENGDTDVENIQWSFNDNFNGLSWEVRYQSTSFGASCSGGTLAAGPTAWSGTSGSTTLINVGGLSSDRYYCVLVSDDAGHNAAFDEMFVDVTGAIAPIVTVNPADVTYESGDTQTENIQWSFTDEIEGDTWEVRYQSTSFGASCSGGTQLDSGSWASSTGDSTGTYNIGGFTADRYYCLGITDQAANTAFDEMFLDITPDIDPIFTATPSDIQYESGNTATRNIEWSFTDEVEGYTWEIESSATPGGGCIGGTPELNGNWEGQTSETSFAFDVGSLTSDTYFCMLILDRGGNIVVDEMFVDVVVAANPTYSAQPSDVQYENGDTDVENIQWSFNDNFNGLSWEVRYQASSFGASCTGGTQLDTNTWSGTSGSTGTYDVGSLSADRYYCVSVLDDAGHSAAFDEVFVDITTSTPPIVTVNPSDVQYENGDTQTNNIQWSFTDEIEGDSWEVRYQATTFGASCTGGTLLEGPTSWATTTGASTSVHDVGSLTSDRYYCLGITDQAGNTAFDEMFVDVVTQVDPFFTSTAPDYDYESGNTVTRNIDWDFEDNIEGDTWEVFYSSLIGTACSANSLDSGSWAGGTTGSTGIYDTGSLTADRYYCAVIIDQTGGQTTHTQSVIVVTQQIPQITANPSDDAYEAGNVIVRNVQWTATDSYETTYTIERSFNGGSWGEVRGSTSWVSSVAIGIYDVGSLAEGLWTFRIIFLEETSAQRANSGQAISGNLTITVAADSAPQITSTPSDDDYEDGNTNVRNIQWTATDSYPDTYTLEFRKDDGSWSLFRNTGWTSGNPIADVDVGSLTVGTWDYRINFTETTGDSQGRTTSSTITVTVAANQAPIITANPSDDAYEDGNTITRNVQWTATDSYAATYTIERSFNGGAWGEVRGSTSWLTGVAIGNYDVGSLAVGIWTFRILFLENTANATGKLTTSGNLTIIVALNEAPIITVNPSDDDYEDGNTITRNVQWTATDSYPATYTIERSFNGGVWGEVRGSTSWLSGVAIGVYDVGSLAQGVWTFRIIFLENTANATGKLTTSGNLTITIALNQIAQITSSPSDDDYEDGNIITRNVQWTATDSYPDTYIIQRQLNGGGYTTVRSATIWLSGVPIAVYDVGSLTVGVWDFRVNFAETSTEAQGRSTTDIVTITVALNQAPVITINPSNENYEDGNIITRNIQWTATDSYPATYTIERSFNGGIWGEVRGSTSWLSGVAIGVYDVGSLAQGVWTFRIIFLENTANATGKSTTSGNLTTTVALDQAPLFSLSPNDDQYEFGTVSFVISWSFTDNFNGSTYDIYRSTDNSSWGSAVASGVWNGVSHGPVNYDAGSLIIKYYYLFNITDEAFNFALDYMFITVTPRILLQDLSLSESLDGSVASEKSIYAFSGADENPGANWRVYRNGSIVNSGSWTNNSLYYIFLADDGSLSDGVYNFTLVIDDADGIYFSTAIHIYTYTGLSPIFINSPSDFTEEVNLLNSIQWAGIDHFPDTYKIFRNGSLSSSNSWNEGNYISHNVNDLTVGVHNVTIQLFDIAGRSSVDIVIITVVNDNVSPIFVDRENNLAIATGSTGNILSWTAFDLHSSSYTLLRNGSSVSSGSWDSNIAISINIDDFGYTIDTLYNFTIIITDAYGFSIQDEIWVYAKADDGIPTILINPIDFGYSIGATNNYIQWAAVDNFPATYNITRNGGLVIDDTWGNENYIRINVDGLTVGIYTFIINVYDTSGNSVSDTVVVTVT